MKSYDQDSGVRVQGSGQQLNPKPLALYFESGFTLIEFMIAASILGLIGLSILTTFGSGFSVYERVQAFGGVQTDALLALEEMERDIRNIFPFSTIPIDGQANRFSFPAVIERTEEVEGEEVLRETVGKTGYFLDSSGGPGAKVLSRFQEDYPQALTGHAPGSPKTLLSVSDLAFRYYSFNAEEGTYFWGNTWSDKDGSDLKAVEITLTYPDVNRDSHLVRSVLVSAAGSANALEEQGEENGEGENEVEQSE